MTGNLQITSNSAVPPSAEFAAGGFPPPSHSTEAAGSNSFSVPEVEPASGSQAVASRFPRGAAAANSMNVTTFRIDAASAIHSNSSSSVTGA